MKRNMMDIASLLTDDYAIKILVATYHKPRNAIEISQKLDIPIAACYRRIHALEDAGLLHAVETKTTSKGRKIVFYRSLLKNAYLFFEDGRLKVRLEMINGTEQVLENQDIVA